MKEQDTEEKHFVTDVEYGKPESSYVRGLRKFSTPDTENGVSLPYPTDAAPEGFAEEVLNLKDFEFDTPDTTWERKLEHFIQEYPYGRSSLAVDLTKRVQDHIEDLLTSRDTYWKERMLTWIEKNESFNEFPEPHIFANDLREFITNEDNLK